MQKRSSITQTPLSKVKSPIATLDIMYLKELHKRGFVASSHYDFSNSSQIEGAYVIEPKKDFYKNIFVFDFKSLYPSIIMTFNIDPFTFTNENQSKQLITAPNGANFSREKGILPDLIKQIYLEREIAKKENDDIKSYALKITMNSFYGAIASPKSRYYNRNIGEAITSFGRKILLKAKAFVEKRGDIVIYGDTDSIFVKINGLDSNNLEEMKRYGKQIETKLNEFFMEWIEHEFKLKSYLKIELEKIYSKFFIASKKRYVGFDLMKGKKQFVGMEAIRGDWTELARNFQKELVELIFNESKLKDIKKYIIVKINDLKAGKYDSELIYTKKITKPLTEYTKTTPPHVKAARELKNFHGQVVRYIMTKNGPKHINLIKENKKHYEYDYEHYIEKQLKGVSDDLLETIGIDFDSIIDDKKQTKLDKYFSK